MKTPQVLAVSFMMKSHARLIQGYFDDDELKIQFTEAHNFDVGEPGYTTTMNDFLKWAGAVPQGNTRLLERYPIDELINPKPEAEKTPSSPETKPPSGIKQHHSARGQEMFPSHHNPHRPLALVHLAAAEVVVEVAVEDMVETNRLPITRQLAFNHSSSI